MTFEDMTYELRLTNKRLESAQSELRQLVTTDPLTGCRNRRFFDEIIGREIERHRRYHIPLSLLFVDVDRFKAINDTLGHEAGDRVLQRVAAFLVRNVREADYVFRWGGDEFLILISCREEEAVRKAVRAAEGLRGVVRGRPRCRPASGLSIGCAEVPATATDIMADREDRRRQDVSGQTRRRVALATGSNDSTSGTERSNVSSAFSDTADTYSAAVSSAPPPADQLRGDGRRILAGPDAREPVLRSEQPLGRFELVLGAVQLVQQRGDLDADAHRADRGPVGDDHEHAAARLVRVLAGRRREAHRVEADARAGCARSARPTAPRRRSRARRSARTACRFRARPTRSSLRSRRSRDRASPGSGSACSATG